MSGVNSEWSWFLPSQCHTFFKHLNELWHHQWRPAAGCDTHISGGSATGTRGHQRPGHDSLERNVLVALFIDSAEVQQKPPQPEIIRGRYCRFVYKSPLTNANKSTTKIYTIRTQ